MGFRGLPIAAFLLASSCGRPEPWERPGTWYRLCVARFHSFGSVRGVLERHGIESFTLDSSLGADSIYVVGRDTAFEARRVLLEHSEREKLNLGWTADHLVHGPDEDDLRVAEVSIVSGSTGPVLDLLESRGIDVRFTFGSVKDCIEVPRDRVREALNILRERPIPGVDVMAPVGFD